MKFIKLLLKIGLLKKTSRYRKCSKCGEIYSEWFVTDKYPWDLAMIKGIKNEKVMYHCGQKSNFKRHGVKLNWFWK